MPEKEKQYKQYYKEIPTGTGRESEPKEILPAVEVKNEVEWVNPEFKELPFDIKEGEPTKFGVFLTPKPKEGEKIIDLRVAEQHKRSGLLGRAVFRDEQGRLYRDIDLKGIGRLQKFPKEGFRTLQPHIETPKEKTAWGIFEKIWAKPARDNLEEILAKDKNIRTERYIALIKLEEIVDKDGKKISIDEAVKRKILNPEQEPIAVLRAFGTKFRIKDSSKKNLEDARQLVAQELGISEKDFSWQDYMRWFAKTAGENLGLIHKAGWHHKYLSPHNITLDCRIVDFDDAKDMHSSNKREKEDMMQRDYSSLSDTTFADYFCLPGLFLRINRFTDKKFDHSTQKKLQKIFKESYKKSLGYTPEFLKEKESRD